jgi:outer membrane murein-binding lipoprotein Lpp
MHRTELVLASMILASMFLAGCAHRQVQVLPGPPAAAYRTLGMVSAQGENEESAMGALGEQAARLDADAVVVESRRPVGRVIIVTGRAIKYLGPPPEPQAAPPPQEPQPGGYPPPQEQPPPPPY